MRVLAMLMLLTGCGPTEVEWEIVFESPALRAEAVSIDVQVLANGCAGDEVFSSYGGGEAPPPLDPEITYCFFVQAENANCETIGVGQETVSDLGERDVLTITVRAAGPVSLCGPTDTCCRNPLGGRGFCLPGGETCG
jgi:hypothetical protein